MKKVFNSQRGQGLLEMVVAIGVINIGLFAVWGLFLSNYAGEQESRARVIGSNLAKEGIEVVRNIRDSNWLKVEDNQGINGDVYSWDYGLDGLTGSEIGGGYFYTIKGLFDISDNLDLEKTDDLSDSKIYLRTDGFYGENEDNAKNTNYSRKIILRDLCCQDNEGDLSCDNYEIDFCDGQKNFKIGIDVESVVDWQIKNKNRQSIIKDQLFNWK